jgi:hypothetical protein
MKYRPGSAALTDLAAQVGDSWAAISQAEGSFGPAPSSVAQAVKDGYHALATNSRYVLLGPS